MKRFLVVLLLSLYILIPFSSVNASSMGVGIGSGKITIDEDLKNGMIYKFPNLVVINTGDVESDYSVVISYDQDQKELLPPSEWFTFSPEVFRLKPGESQSVEIRLKLPIDKVAPGDYFAYLEAMPVIADQAGIATVGISAAAKLYFTIAPSNFLVGIFYTVKYFFEDYQPWTTIVVVLGGLLLLRTIFVKFFSFNLNIKVKNKKDQKK